MTEPERVFQKDFTATYSGDRRNFDKKELCGPNTRGEFFLPVQAEYDSEKNVTRISYHIVTKEKFKEVFAKELAALEK